MCLTRVFAALAPRNYSKEVSHLRFSNLEKNGNESLTGSVLRGSSSNAIVSAGWAVSLRDWPESKGRSPEEV